MPFFFFFFFPPSSDLAYFLPPPPHTHLLLAMTVSQHQSEGAVRKWHNPGETVGQINLEHLIRMPMVLCTVSYLLWDYVHLGSLEELLVSYTLEKKVCENDECRSFVYKLENSSGQMSPVCSPDRWSSATAHSQCRAPRHMQALQQGAAFLTFPPQISGATHTGPIPPQLYVSVFTAPCCIQMVLLKHLITDSPPVIKRQ